MAIPKKKQTDIETIEVQPARIIRVRVPIQGTAPLVMNKFSEEARRMMLEEQQKDKAGKARKKEHPPRDIDREFEQLKHVSTDGWYGMPCGAFRKAMVDACRLANVVMVRAKMAVFIIPDGIDSDDGAPLVRIVSDDEPERAQHYVRLASGKPSVAVRPMFREWTANVTVEFDADSISLSSVVNLLDRAGRQIGIGAGRPFSTNSVGMGWGTFVTLPDEVQDAEERK